MQEAERERVGIIGAGRIGTVMAQIASRGGRQVVISNSRGPESLASLVEELGEGVTAGTVEDAAGADIVVLAVMWPQVPQAVAGLDWDGRILIDPTNDFDPTDLGGRTSSEVVADLVAPARVVKAANTLGAPVLGTDPHQAGGQRVIFVSGDDGRGKVGRREAVRGRGLLRDRRRWVARRRPDAAVPRPSRRPQPDPSPMSL
jgi:predicted dinucleotide-binding enzyme